MRAFLKAIRYGSKFTYQSVPRLLTIWLDMGENATLRKTESFNKVMGDINSILPDIPAYKVCTGYSWRARLPISRSGIRPSHK